MKALGKLLKMTEKIMLPIFASFFEYSTFYFVENFLKIVMRRPSSSVMNFET